MSYNGAYQFQKEINTDPNTIESTFNCAIHTVTKSSFCVDIPCLVCNSGYGAPPTVICHFEDCKCHFIVVCYAIQHMCGTAKAQGKAINDVLDLSSPEDATGTDPLDFQIVDRVIVDASKDASPSTALVPTRSSNPLNSI
eukprot:jgi/Psemu1/41387/gm1.41387_g